jgi:hypothetical protein
MPQVVENVGVFNNSIVLISSDDLGVLGVLTSELHRSWAIRHGTAVETRPRYKSSAAFDTFPFPTSDLGDVRSSMQLLDSARTAARRSVGGFTAVYNKVNDSQCAAPAIDMLRRLHADVDHAVLEAIKASGTFLDLPDDLGHGFHQTGAGVAWTIDPGVREQVLTASLRENYRLHASQTNRTYQQVVAEATHA